MGAEVYFFFTFSSSEKMTSFSLPLEWLFCFWVCYMDKDEKDLFIMGGKSIKREAFTVRL